MKLNIVSQLIVANVVLAAGLIFLWHDPSHFQWNEPMAVRPALDDLSLPSASQPAEVSRYRETVSRPLFSATRRPGAQKTAGDDNREIDPLRDLRLLGVYGAGDRGGAIVNSSGKVQRVRFGEKIGDWTIASADGRSASLVNSSGERRSLLMPTASSAPPAASPTARGAAETTATAPSSDTAAAPPAPRSPRRVKNTL